MVVLINGTSTDRLKFWVKLHFDADSLMCSAALETCDKYFSSLKKIKSVKDSNNTTVLAVLVNCMVYVKDFYDSVNNEVMYNIPGGNNRDNIAIFGDYGD